MFFSLEKYGDDSEINKPIIAEYAPPSNLDTIEMGLLLTDGRIHPSFITAAIIKMAKNGLLKIKEVEKVEKKSCSLLPTTLNLKKPLLKNK